jgi:hypothetical protein
MTIERIRNKLNSLKAQTDFNVLIDIDAYSLDYLLSELDHTKAQLERAEECLGKYRDEINWDESENTIRKYDDLWIPEEHGYALAQQYFAQKEV